MIDVLELPKIPLLVLPQPLLELELVRHSCIAQHVPRAIKQIRVMRHHEVCEDKLRARGAADATQGAEISQVALREIDRGLGAERA